MRIACIGCDSLRGFVCQPFLFFLLLVAFPRCKRLCSVFSCSPTLTADCVGRTVEFKVVKSATVCCLCSGCQVSLVPKRASPEGRNGGFGKSCARNVFQCHLRHSRANTRLHLAGEASISESVLSIPGMRLYSSVQLRLVWVSKSHVSAHPRNIHNLLKSDSDPSDSQ